MKRDFLSRLQATGRNSIISATLLLIGVPVYQFLVLQPQGYASVLTTAERSGSFGPYLLWINTHIGQFLGYRVLLLVAFALLINLPFSLFRIIVAQEILGPEEKEQDGEAQSEETATADVQETRGDNEMPAFAWRGRGYAVIAAWSGLSGIALMALGTLAGSIYLALTGATFDSHAQLPGSFAALASTFTLLTYTIGGGLLALATLFFGAIIARRGRKLWPGVWVAFGYVALALAAFFSGSAVGVASSPIEGQAPLTTPAILLFAVWVLWFGVMLVRLQPEL